MFYCSFQKLSFFIIRRNRPVPPTQHKTNLLPDILVIRYHLPAELFCKKDTPSPTSSDMKPRPFAKSCTIFPIILHKSSFFHPQYDTFNYKKEIM